jgi:hypothetical protein
MYNILFVVKILLFAGNKVTGYSIYGISPENGHTIKGVVRLGRVMRPPLAEQSKGRQNWRENEYFN